MFSLNQQLTSQKFRLETQLFKRHEEDKVCKNLKEFFDVLTSIFLLRSGGWAARLAFRDGENIALAFARSVVHVWNFHGVFHKVEGKIYFPIPIAH